MKRRYLALTAALAFAYVGCLGPDTMTGPTNVCESDLDCGAGVCDTELTMCVSSAREEPLRVAFRVTPEGAPYGVAPLPVDVPPIEIDGPRERNFDLPVPVQVSGLVADALDGQPVPAQVVLQARSVIPGRQAVVIDPSVDALTNDGMFRTNLSTVLLPDTEYTVELRPTGAATATLPPWRPVEVYRSPAAGMGEVFAEDFLRFPNRCAAEQTTDCLATIEGIVIDQDGLPEDNFIVTAVETATGQVISNTVLTGDGDFEPGHFVSVMDVRYLSDPESWSFRIVPSVDRTEAVGPRPTWTVEAVNLFGEGVERIRTPSVEGTVMYEGFVETEDGVSLADVQIDFEARDVVDESSNVVGVFRTSATTDERGRYSVELLPGTYDVVMTPPSGDVGSELAVLRTRVDLTGAGERASGQSFQLPPRQVLGGTVATSTMEAMSGASVVASARPNALSELGEIARHARSTETTTGDLGRFRLPVDVGIYDLTVQPPPGSNFPWLVRVNEEVGGGESALEDRYDIDNPMTLTGVVAYVEGEDRVPTSGGTIEAYAVVDDGEGGERTVLVGRAEIDEEGRYTLLLPPSI